jgi:hypothetical protein
VPGAGGRSSGQALDSGGCRFEFGTGAFVAPYGGLSNRLGTPAGVPAIRAALDL